MPDIADQLDAAIGAAPSDAPALEPTLVLGRRALRRRRLAYGVGAAATALVIGGTAWAVSPGDSGASRSDGLGFDGQPSDSATPPPTEQADGSEEVDAWPGVPRDDLVRWTPEQISLTSGLLPAGDDVTIVAERHPIDIGASFAPPFDTAVAKVTEGSATWYVVARRPDEYIAVSADEARTKYDVADLDEFVDFARDRYAEGGGGLL